MYMYSTVLFAYLKQSTPRNTGIILLKSEVLETSSLQGLAFVQQ